MAWRPRLGDSRHDAIGFMRRGVSSMRQHFRQRRAGRGLLARERKHRHLATEHTFPEAPPAERIAQRALDERAKATGERGERTEARRLDTVEPAPKQRRQQRRAPAGGDGDDDRRPLDDRRHDAGREHRIIDDIDGDAAGARRRGDRLAEGEALIGDDDERDALEERRREALSHVLDLAGARGAAERR